MLINRWPLDTIRAETIALHEQISQVTGLVRNSNRWRTIIAKWKKEVEDRSHFVLLSKYNEGYKFLNESNKVREADRQLRLSENRVRRANQVIRKVRPEYLNKSEAETYQFVIDRVDTILNIVNVKRPDFSNWFEKNNFKIG